MRSSGFWNMRAIAAEAYRNLASAEGRTLLLVLITAILVGSIAAAEVALVSKVTRFQQSFSEAGGYVLVVEAQTGIETASCKSLAEIDGIATSGGFRQSGHTALPQAVQTRLPLGTATSGFLATVDPAQQSHRTVVPDTAIGETIAKSFGITLNSTLHFADGVQQRVTDVLSSARNPSIGRAVIVVDDKYPTSDQCWVEVDRAVDEWAEDALLAMLAPIDTSSSVTRVVEAGDFAFNPIEEIRTRPQRIAWPFVGLLIAAVAWLTTWFRRSEFSIYRALGCGGMHIVALVLVEGFSVVIVGAAIGAAWGLALGSTVTGVSVDAELIRFALVVPLMTTSVALILTPIGALAASANILLLLKDR